MARRMQLRHWPPCQAAKRSFTSCLPRQGAWRTFTSRRLLPPLCARSVQLCRPSRTTDGRLEARQRPTAAFLHKPLVPWRSRFAVTTMKHPLSLTLLRAVKGPPLSGLKHVFLWARAARRFLLRQGLFCRED